MRRVERNELMTPTMCVSFGGELDELHALPGFDWLREACSANNVEFFETVMSLTSMVNLGRGGLALGYAAETGKVEL